MTSLAGTPFGAASVRVFILRSGARDTLKLSALATWHLLCHLTLGWPLYKSESVLSRKAYLEQPGSGEPSAKACWQLPTGFTVKQRQLPTGCFAQPMSNAAGQRDKLSSAVRFY
jgi:hypothetical protein